MCRCLPWSAVGAILAGLAVAAGAFAAHGLDQYFPKKYAGQTREVGGETVPAARKYADDFRTAAAYQMYHALALVAVGLAATYRSGTAVQVAGWAFLLGIVLFSGGLYLLTLAGPRWLGVPWGLVVPFGGVAFLVGWAAFALALLTGKPAPG